MCVATEYVNELATNYITATTKVACTSKRLTVSVKDKMEDGMVSGVLYRWVGNGDCKVASTACQLQLDVGTKPAAAALRGAYVRLWIPGAGTSHNSRTCPPHMQQSVVRGLGRVHSCT